MKKITGTSLFFVSWTGTPDECEEAMKELGLESVMFIDRDVCEVTVRVPTHYDYQEQAWQKSIYQTYPRLEKTAAVILRTSDQDLTEFWNLVERKRDG